MKYILILYICTMSTQPHCEQDQIVNRKFTNYYDCITVGYLNSYLHLTKMYDRDEVIKNKLAIKFECKKIGTPT